MEIEEADGWLWDSVWEQFYRDFGLFRCYVFQGTVCDGSVWYSAFDDWTFKGDDGKLVGFANPKEAKAAAISFATRCLTGALEELKRCAVA